MSHPFDEDGVRRLAHAFFQVVRHSGLPFTHSNKRRLLRALKRELKEMERGRG